MTPRPSSWWCSSAVALLAFALGSAPGLVHALSCCGSIQAQADRLGPDEARAVLFGVGGQLSLGSFFPDGRFVGHPAGTREADALLRLSYVQRLSAGWQASVEGGWSHGWRSFGADNSTAGAPTDLLLGARYDPVALPSVAFMASLSLPTGREAASSRDLLGADVTSLGTPSLRVGGVFEHVFEVWFVNAGLAASGRPSTAHTAATATLEGMVSAGRSFSSGIGVAGSLLAALSPNQSSGGLAIHSTSRRRVALALSAGVPLSTRTTLAATVTLDPPIDGLGRNEPGRAQAMLALRALLPEGGR